MPRKGYHDGEDMHSFEMNLMMSTRIRSMSGYSITERLSCAVLSGSPASKGQTHTENRGFL